MKPFTYKHWHAWLGVSSKILLSDELNKNLYSFDTLDECINFLFTVPYREDSKEAARALNEHIKEYTRITWTRVTNDLNGNPRYVCHFLYLNTEDEKNSDVTTDSKYGMAVVRAKKLGGKRYHTKAYGGGIVFQSYSLSHLEASINHLLEYDK